MELNEILFVSNFDTLIPLCEKSKVICERGLMVSSNTSERQSYPETLFGAVNKIGFIYDRAWLGDQEPVDDVCVLGARV